MRKSFLFLFVVVVISVAFVSCASMNSFLSAEESILVNRGFLEHSIPDGKIYVIGHKSPDTDTVGSAVAYANLLNNLGYDCEARMAGKASNETKYVFELCNMELPQILEDATGKNIILVDNNEAVNAVDGIENSNIIAVVDHHLINPVRSSLPIHFESERTGATASIIAAYYQRYGVEVTPQMAKLLALTILADSSGLSGSETTEADLILFDNLAGMAGLSDVDAIYENMKQAKNSYDGMTDTEIYHSDYKEYEANGVHYSIGYVRATDEEAVKLYLEKMAAEMEEEYKDGKLDFLTCNVTDKKNDITYLAYYGPDAEAVCRQAFSDIAVFEDGYLIINPSVSRKTVLAPRINSVI